MNHMTPKTWLSLGALALVAIVFGLGATGVLDTTERVALNQEAAAIASAEAALDDSWTSSAEIVAEMRADIENNYTDVDGKIRADWQGIYYDLGTLEDQLRAGNNAALQSLQELILEMNTKIQAESSE